jgi:multidrug resistance efflux pump
MPARRRPKAPPAPPLSDVERFALAVRESEEAARRAKQAAADRKTEALRRKTEAAAHKVRLEAAQAAHRRAVELVKEAQRTGRGVVEADQAWRIAKAELIEVETGQPPAWAPKPVDPEHAEADEAPGENSSEA